MGTIYRNGTAFIGSGGAGGVELTQAEYDALPTSEKMNGSIYFISDGEASYPSASTMRYDNSSSGLTATSVQAAVDEVNEKVNDNAWDIAELNNGLTNVDRSTCTMAANWTTTQNRVLKKTGFIELYVECLFSGTYTSGWNHVCTIPAGYRPIETFDMVSLDNGVSTAPACDIKIEQGGAVRVYNNTGTSKNLRIHAVYMQGN